MKIHNSFHGKSANIRLTRDELDWRVMAANAGDTEARKYLRTVKARLCGSLTCTCSGRSGERK